MSDGAGYTFDQARWSDDGGYVPLLSETSGETAEPGDALPDDLLQVCVTERTVDHVDGLVAALAEVVA